VPNPTIVTVGCNNASLEPRQPPITVTTIDPPKQEAAKAKGPKFDPWKLEAEEKVKHALKIKWQMKSRGAVAERASIKSEWGLGEGIYNFGKEVEEESRGEGEKPSKVVHKDPRVVQLRLKRKEKKQRRAADAKAKQLAAEKKEESERNALQSKWQEEVEEERRKEDLKKREEVFKRGLKEKNSRRKK